MRIALVFTLLGLMRFAFAQTDAPTAPVSAAASPAPAPLTQIQASLDRLAQSNRDMLEVLKKQQALLEDVQFDRRLQSRQIESLEERLHTALLENSQLQSKVAHLEADAAARPPAGLGTAAVASAGVANAPPSPPVPGPVADVPPPSTYLPPPELEGQPGTQSWHRLFTLKGEQSKQTDLFQIRGRKWRVLWHNQDRPGKALQNTSGLFINAFPRDDTIPQKVCEKVGSGGDSAEFTGAGNYYLKIDASGGSWELAVEDFR